MSRAWGKLVPNPSRAYAESKMPKGSIKQAPDSPTHAQSKPRTGLESLILTQDNPTTDQVQPQTDEDAPRARVITGHQDN